MTEGRPLRLKPDAVRWREVDQEVIAVDLATSTYLSANESGLVLWKLLAEGATRDELTRELERRFSIDHNRAAADVDEFVAALVERDLLEDADES